jgi:hypothetical protein
MREIDNFNSDTAPELKYAQDIRMGNIYYGKLLAIEYTSVFFGLYGMGLSIILNELAMNDDITED